MEFIQQNINFQKSKLLNLINNLINNQIINQEIFINNEIKKESELLASFLIEKQNFLINQNVMNNNNINPFLMSQPNLMMNAPQMNINTVQIPQARIIDKNLNNLENANQNKVINIQFLQEYSKKIFVINCFDNDRISDIIKLYRKKANDYNDNFFIYNMRDLNGSNSTLNELKIYNNSQIRIERKGDLKGGKYGIHIFI